MILPDLSDDDVLPPLENDGEDIDALFRAGDLVQPEGPVFD